MEKKRTNFFIRAKLTFTAIFLTMIFSTHAQKLETFKNYCGGFYKSMADLLKMQQKEIGFYNLRSGQTIASIGVQCYHWEVAHPATTDSVPFILKTSIPVNSKRARLNLPGIATPPSVTSP